MKKYLLRLLFLLLVFFLSPRIQAQEDTLKQTSGLYEFSLEDLMNIQVVTASGSAQMASDAPSTIRVITAQQIQERGYQQLEDVLRDIEGVDLVHVGGYVPTIIYFRGMYGAENLRTLLLIDGIRENNLLGTIDLAGPAYSLHNVERIEIIWGPASALYGADAFGGVINIITKKGAQMNSVYYEKGYGTFNTSEDRLMLGMKKNNFDLSFSGSLYSTDGPLYRNRDPYYTGAFVDKARSFSGSLGYTYKKVKTTLGFRSYDTPMSWGNFLNSSTDALSLPSQGYGNSGSIGILSENINGDHPSLYDAFSNTFFLQSEVAVSSKLTLLATGSFHETGIGNKSFVYLSIDTPISRGIDTVDMYRVPTYNSSNEVKGELSGNYILSEHQKLTGGVQFFQDNLENGNRREILDTNKYVIDGIHVTNLYPIMKPRLYTIRNNFGSYLQYVLSTNLLHKTSVTLGARYDQNTDYTNPVSPRLAIINQPNNQFTIKLLYGTAFRAPTVTEVAAEISATGKKAVNPEKVSTYEMNLIYKPSQKVLVQVNGFDNELSDIFVLNSLIGGNLGIKQSLGSASIKGAEMHLDVFPNSTCNGFMNLTYQEGRQKDEKTGARFDTPNLPKWKGNIGTSCHSQILTLTVIENWVGERQLPVSNPFGADKGYKMKGYFVTNAVLTTKKFYENRISASVNVQNVFNQNYLNPGMRTADGVLYSTVMEQPGRTILFKVMIDLH